MKDYTTYTTCFFVALNGAMRRERHPIRIVKMAVEVAEEAEKHLNEARAALMTPPPTNPTVDDSIPPPPADTTPPAA